MSEIRTVTTLRSKRDEIAGAVAKYEGLLGQARADLAHIEAAIAIFEASGDPKGFPAYVDVQHLFKRGEQTRLCLAALVDGPLTTRQLALYIMKAKGLNQADKVLAKSIGSRLIHALRLLRRQRRVVTTGRVKAALIWELPPEKKLV
ncbi:MAG TPA: hypothetical protein VFA53_07090 [Xanthobacteraceae bacterium]|nr:hypothetical protein [Xanthobacteraceae bacterium]